LSTSLLTALLLLAGPADLPVRPAAPATAEPPATSPTPAIPAAPAATAATAPIAAPGGAPELRLPRGGLEPSALAAPALLLAGLGAAAYVLRRRRRPASRRVQVLETTSLGPKRSLVLARFEDELLLLGASEAGIQLLHHRPSLAPAAEEAQELEPAPPARETPAGLAGLVTRLRSVRPAVRQAQGGRGHAAQGPEFDALLAESAEDQELRRKLARGQGGSVR
jgi:flagellar biogenesis protein FliO